MGLSLIKNAVKSTSKICTGGVDFRRGFCDGFSAPENPLSEHSLIGLHEIRLSDALVNKLGLELKVLLYIK